jgi:hypothetical protein
VIGIPDYHLDVEGAIVLLRPPSSEVPLGRVADLTDLADAVMLPGEFGVPRAEAAWPVQTRPCWR